MTRGASPRLPRRGGTLILWIALLVGVSLIGTAAPLSAQYEQLLSERQNQYDAALFDYQSRQKSWDAQESVWRSALDAVRAAQASGNAQRLQRADEQALNASRELQRLRRQVEEVEPILAERRIALQAALEQRANALQVEVSSATGSLRQRMNDQIGTLYEQIRRLEPQVARAQTLLFFPEYAADPRDGRSDIQLKIEFLERRSREAQAYLDRLSGELQRWRRIEAQQRLQRDAASNPFGDDPPGARAGRPPEPQPPSSGQDAAAPMTIQQRIEALTAAQSELQNLRRQLEARIAAFRVTLISMGGDLR